MKTKFGLLLALCLISITGFCTKWTVTNSGFTFSPDTLTIALGDSVFFNIASAHNVVEVSQSTWNANGNTPLPGFSLPFGGGLLLPAQLTLGTHYYVCSPHASSGMKGTIIVYDSTTTGIPDIPLQTSFSVFPNPSNGTVWLTVGKLQSPGNCNLRIYDIKGKMVYETKVNETISSIDLSELTNGVYLIRLFNGKAILTRKIVIQ